MKKQRKPYTPEEKVAILRRHLVEKEPISKLCDELGLQPRVFYRWQKEFFENGAVAFEQKARPNHSAGRFRSSNGRPRWKARPNHSAGRFRSSNGRPRWSWPFQPQQIKRVEMLWASAAHRSEEHTSELQSLRHLV